MKFLNIVSKSSYTINKTTKQVGGTIATVTRMEINTLEASNTCLYYNHLVNETMGTTTTTRQADKLTWIGYCKNKLTKPRNTMFDMGSDITNWDELELSSHDYVFKQLSNPHGRVDQGFIMSGWRTAKVDTDKCQCTLVLATGQIDLLAIVHSPVHSQPMVQDIPKETAKGSTLGL